MALNMLTGTGTMRRITTLWSRPPHERSVLTVIDDPVGVHFAWNGGRCSAGVYNIRDGIESGHRTLPGQPRGGGQALGVDPDLIPDVFNVFMYRGRVVGVSKASTVWTVGHSNHSWDRFLGLLRACQIEVVADVRSQPYSKYAQHFSQSPLSRALADAGLDYLFFGRELGGRPPEAELYDVEGHVLYGALAETRRFIEGLARLRDVACEHRVAMMCSEEDPSQCHRRLLVTRAMLVADPAPSVRHIRGDGTVVGEIDLTQAIQGARQLGLFEEVATWRSARSASPSTLLRDSSAR